MFRELKEDFKKKNASMIRSATTQRPKAAKNLKLNPSTSTSAKRPLQAAARRKPGPRKVCDVRSQPARIEASIPNDETPPPKPSKRQSKQARRSTLYNQLSYNWIDTKPTAISENDIAEADILDYETCAVECELPSETNSQKITYNNHWLNNVRNLYPDMTKVASNVRRTKPLEDISCLAQDLMKASTMHVRGMRKSNSLTMQEEPAPGTAEETYAKLQKFFIDILESTCNAKSFDIDSVSSATRPRANGRVCAAQLENSFACSTLDDDITTIHSSHSSIDCSTYKSPSQLGLREIDNTIRNYEKYLKDLLKTAADLNCESLKDAENDDELACELEDSCVGASNTNTSLNNEGDRQMAEENAEMKLRRKIKKKLRKNETVIKESTYMDRMGYWDKPKGQIELFESLMKLVHNSVNNDTDKRYRLEYAFLHNDVIDAEAPAPRRLRKPDFDRGYSKKTLKSMAEFKKHLARMPEIAPKSAEKAKKRARKCRKTVKLPAQCKKLNRV